MQKLETTTETSIKKFKLDDRKEICGNELDCKRYHGKNTTKK